MITIYIIDYFAENILIFVYVCMKKIKGFTLVELLAVIVVLGILVSITIILYTGYKCPNPTLLIIRNVVIMIQHLVALRHYLIVFQRLF